MPVIIPPGFIQMTVNMTSARSSHECRNVYGFAVADVLTQSQVDDISDAVATAYKPLMNSASTYHGIRILEGQDGGDPIEWNSVSSNGAGTTTGDLTAPQVMFLVKKTTALSGRHNRGRTFMIDPKESQVNDDGTLNSGAISALATFANAVFGDVASVVGGAMQILHSTSLAPTQVTAFAGENKVATLRGRFPRT